MKKSTIAAALVIIFSILFFGNLPAQNSVIIKDGNTLITYRERVSSSTEKVYMIETNTYTTGTDLATLKGLNVPTEYWPFFANNEYMIFSTKAVELQKENKRLQEELNAESEERSSAQNSFEIYRLIFWVTLVFATITILILAISLVNSKKELRRARNSR